MSLGYWTGLCERRSYLKAIIGRGLYLGFIYGMGVVPISSFSKHSLRKVAEDIYVLTDTGRIYHASKRWEWVRNLTKTEWVVWKLVWNDSCSNHTSFPSRNWQQLHLFDITPVIIGTLKISTLDWINRCFPESEGVNYLWIIKLYT